MKNKRFLSVVLILLFAGAAVMAQQNELRPLIDKSVFELIKPEDNVLFPDASLPDFKYRFDQLKFNLLPETNENITVKPFYRIPMRTWGTPRQIYTIQTSGGQVFTIINRTPIKVLDVRDPNNGYGTAVGMDFNAILYSLFHPREKSQKKQTRIHCTQITQYVYTQ